MIRNVRWTLFCALAATQAGCLMAGNYHSARTLEKGTSSFGMTASMTTYEFSGTDSNGQPTVERFSLPNLIPELTYHIGVTNDVEAGGRLSLGSLGMEGDVKFRFYHQGPLHLAIAPAVSYQAAVFIQGTGFRLPGVATYDVADNLSLNVAVYASGSKWESVSDSNSEESAQFDGELLSTGAAFGVELRAETFAIRPSIEFTRYVGSVDNDEFDPFNTVNVLVHIEWVGGREKKQLNRIERKVDRVLDNQEGQPPGGPRPQDDSDYQPPPMK